MCEIPNQSSANILEVLTVNEVVTIILSVLAIGLSILNLLRSSRERKLEYRPLLYWITEGIGQGKEGTEEEMKRTHLVYTIYFKVYNSDLFLFDFVKSNNLNITVKPFNQKGTLIAIVSRFTLNIGLDFNNATQKKERRFRIV
ncbi:MAG TPA: hypothetical protein PLS73_13620 [Saprospiraceae bacterium]|nr:hypothetical protein [Saprospiraceae bacterium]